MVTPDDIKGWLEQGMPGADIWVDGDGHHFEARIINDAFEGKNSIERHRMVYAALGDKMEEAIHALSFKALTKNEATA